MTRRFTVEQVTEAILEIGFQEFIGKLARGRWRAEEEKAEAELSLGTAEFVEAKWGEEGGGENIWVVFKIGDALYQLNGFYNSWEGSEWHDSTLVAVKAEQVMRTIYVDDKE